MGRLTESDGQGNWWLKGVPWKDTYVGQTITANTSEKTYGALCKLKDYEDTGLTPEEIISLNTFDGSQAVKATIKLQEEQRKHRWILVSERLPEDGKQVLVTDRYGEMQIAYHSHEGWHLALTGHIFVHSLKAWMPLPEPYKQDN